MMNPILIRRFYVGCLLTLLAGAFWACNEDVYIEPKRYAVIEGQVRIRDTRQPVKDALVRLAPSGRTVDTDSLGRFRFDSVLVGKYTVQTTFPEYQPDFTTVEADNDRVSVLSILLVRDNAQNRAPNAPTLVKPTAGQDSVPINRAVLKWAGSDPNRDSLTYEVQVFQAGSTTPTFSFTGIRADSVVLNGLQYNTTYYWQVFASDGINVNPTRSQTFTFTTIPFPDQNYVFARRVDGRFQLFSADSTSNALQLTFEGSSWRPIVSPNREQIAFISNRETDLHLYVMDRQGRNVRRVTTVPVGGIVPADLSFCWSPDGTQLLYPSNDRLYVVRTDGTGLRQVSQAPTGRFYAGCDWTDQGNRIVARTTSTSVYDNEIVTMNPDGSNQQLIFARKPGRTSNPVFSVNGKLVMVSHDGSGFQNDPGRQLDARILLIDTANNNNVTDVSVDKKAAGTNDIEPRFSRNGAKILFTNVDNTGIGRRTIFMMDLNGDNRVELIRDGEMPVMR